MMKLCHFATYLLLATSLCFNLHADENPAPVSQDFTVLGVAVLNTAKYSGADEDRVAVMPVFQARRGAFFVDLSRGVGYDMKVSDSVYFQHTFGYSAGRDEKDSDWSEGSDALKGMGKIRGTMNTALTLGYQFTPWFVTELTAKLPLTESYGARYLLAVKSGLWQGELDTFSVEADLLFAGRRANNVFYGVDPQQSLASGFEQYDVAGGIYGHTVYLNWNRRLSKHWSSDVTVGYTGLSRKVKDSPIVAKEDSVDTSFVVTYLF